MYLEVEEINKKIGVDDVLSEISLSMEKGKIYGLQGKNGCGKSMLMRVICGLVLPTSGRVIIDGEELGKELSFPENVGVFIEKPGFLDAYSGFQNLSMLASIKKRIGGREIKETLKRVGLEEVMHKKYNKYSLGMKQKLGIAAVIMEQPDIVILDEPANALDEKSEGRLWQIVREEKERGALVIISCHTAEVLEEISDEIFRIDQGQITDHIVCR
jgi:ABC-type multidrug transport system, ATPase component